MEAMALEVEEIEKTKGEEKAMLVAQTEKLERLCNFYKQTSSKQANALKKLGELAKQLAKEHNANSAAHRKELTDMGYVDSRMNLAPFHSIVCPPVGHLPSSSACYAMHSSQIKSFYLPSLLAQLREASDLVAKTNLKYRREMLERKRLHNLVQELKGNIRVFMRCRLVFSTSLADLMRICDINPGPYPNPSSSSSLSDHPLGRKRNSSVRMLCASASPTQEKSKCTTRRTERKCGSSTRYEKKCFGFIANHTVCVYVCIRPSVPNVLS